MEDLTEAGVSFEVKTTAAKNIRVYFHVAES